MCNSRDSHEMAGEIPPYTVYTTHCSFVHGTEGFERDVYDTVRYVPRSCGDSRMIYISHNQSRDGPWKGGKEDRASFLLICKRDPCVNYVYISRPSGQLFSSFELEK